MRKNWDNPLPHAMPEDVFVPSQVQIGSVRVVLGLFSARFGCFAGLCVLAAEAFDASGGVDQLLFAGEKRVAIGANFQVDIALMRRSGDK